MGVIREGFLREEGDSFIVGTVKQDGGEDYQPMEISIDGGLLYLVTDKYEGVAILNTEALPSLIEALTRLRDRLAAL